MKILLKNGYVWTGECFQKLNILYGEPNILEVGSASGDDEADRIVDAEGKYVMPGVVDAHVHIGQSGGPTPSKVFGMMNEKEALIESIKNCRILLKSGVTTFRECGGYYNETLALRDGIAQGKIQGPSMVACARPIRVVGGHFRGNTPTGPVEFRKEARQLISEGVDFLKVMVNGGLSGDGKEGEDPFSLEMHYDELAAVCEVGRNRHRPVVAHCHTKEAMLISIKAGVSTIEHATFIDDEVSNLVIRDGIWVIPTFMCYEQIAKMGVESGILPETVQVVKESILPAKRKNFRRAYELGVKFAMGRDSGAFYCDHDDYPGELKAMENAGMSRLDVIKSCTENSSKAIGVWNTAGSIEPGKWADFVVLNRDPLENLDYYRERYMVVKFGKIITGGK